MATHNQVRIVGFLLNDPIITNENDMGEEQVLISIRACNRELDGYYFTPFQDVFIYYDDNDNTDLLKRLKSLNAYDMVDIKGVFNVLSVNKWSDCPECGEENVKLNGTSCFVYPISCLKLNNLQTMYQENESVPEKLLLDYYQEVSNHIILIGNVMSEPEMTGTPSSPCCRYQLGIERKYFIKTQEDMKYDYPYVYSYGKQAKNDIRYLKPGALVFLEGFIRNRKVQSDMVCENCGTKYQYPSVASELIPYSIEYLRGYYTDEELEEMEEKKEKKEPDPFPF